MTRFYVKRTSKQNAAGFAYVGPMAENQAQKEAQAWESAGESAEILEATAAIKAEVKRWDKATHAEDSKEIVFFRGEQMTMAAYRLNYEAA